MTPEGKIKLLVKGIISSVPNTHSHWPVMNGMGAPTLDCIGARASDGRMFAVETKAPGQRDKITQRQAMTGNKMRHANVAVFVIDGAGEDSVLLSLWLRVNDLTPPDAREQLDAEINERFRTLAKKALGLVDPPFGDPHDV